MEQSLLHACLANVSGISRGEILTSCEEGSASPIAVAASRRGEETHLLFWIHTVCGFFFFFLKAQPESNFSFHSEQRVVVS